MNSIENVEVRIKSIIKKICDREIDFFDSNVFIAPVNISRREMAYIFLKIEEEFHLDLNDLIDDFKTHTINALISCVENSIKINPQEVEKEYV